MASVHKFGATFTFVYRGNALQNYREYKKTDGYLRHFKKLVANSLNGAQVTVTVRDFTGKVVVRKVEKN